jgi:hypothetical protein
MNPWLKRSYFKWLGGYMLISKKSVGLCIMLVLTASVYPFGLIQAESFSRASVRTLASVILEAVSAPEFSSARDLAQGVEQTSGDFSLAASTISDHECLNDGPLNAGINFEKELDCQGQLLESKGK